MKGYLGSDVVSSLISVAIAEERVGKICKEEQNKPPSDMDPAGKGRRKGKKIKNYGPLSF